MSLKPIETYYKGYRFRSRLEARWAIFFDFCGADWEYEPEGYDLGDGIYYLPDFLLHGVKFIHGGVEAEMEELHDLYVEVKGVMNETDAEKIRRFHAAGKPVLIVGRIPEGNMMGEIMDNITAEAYSYIPGIPTAYSFGTVDDDDFPAIPGADTAGGLNLYGHDSNYLDTLNRQKTMKAYLTARQARFEHGEVPRG